MVEFSLRENFVHEITEENNFEKSIGGLFVPESMWRMAHALVLTWIDVSGFNNVLISLWKLGNSSRELVDIWGVKSSKVIENWIVKESYWDEELLPGKSPSNLDKHTSGFECEFFGIFVINYDVFYSIVEFWEIVIINESSSLRWHQDGT